MPANGDGQPPPSTLAAQIVQNQTRPPTGQHPPGEKATFAQLLHELLNNPAAAPETDIEVNVKLISVLAEAGLAPLLDGNPFADWDTLLTQAIDSLTVIEATIGRQPAILFESTSVGGPQLFLSLLASIAALSGHPKCNDLPIIRLLSATLGVLKASLDLWQYVHTLREALQDCVEEAVSSLEAADTAAPNASIKLPPTRTISRIWPQSDKEITLPHGSQSTISDASSIFTIAVKLSSIDGMCSAWTHETAIRMSHLLPKFRDSLEQAGQHDLALQILLTPSISPLLLSKLFQEAQTAIPTALAQKSIAPAMLVVLRSESEVSKDLLVSPLLELAGTEHFEALDEDLKIATVALLYRCRAHDRLPERITSLYRASSEDEVMADTPILESDQLSSKNLEIARPLKRRRRKAQLLHSTNEQSTPSMDLDASLAVGEDQQLALWQELIRLAGTQPAVAIDAISNLIERPGIEYSKEVRVLSMLAIKASAERSSDSSYLDLRRSAFGQACLRSLHSSLKELRFAAGQALPAFLRNDLPDDLRMGNRQVALEYLRALSDRDVACEHDTIIAAWGQVALVCDETELNLSLLRLVEYLGHSNPLICGLAFAELEKLAGARDQSVTELFKPFWSSVAVSVVQDLHSRPQKAQQFCELAGSELNQWLVQTQNYTVPTLVLTKKREILARIAAARGATTSIYELCVSPKTNLVAILSLLLSQGGPEIEELASACLSDASSDFPDLSTLVKGEATLLGCAMLKSIGAQDDQKKSRSYQAFQAFANIVQRRPGQTRAHSKSSKTVAEYFDNHILGILNHFSEVLENAQGLYPVQDKILCIRAISEMIVMIKQQVSIALPQMRATLHSAMEQEELCEAAFAVWLDLISTLEGEDIAAVLEETFALILRDWSHLTMELQHVTHDKISALVKSYNQVIQDNVMTLPSLKDIPLLTKLGSEIERLKSNEGVEMHCKAFAKRLRNESSIVVLQALREIVPFLEERQDFIHESAVSEPPPVVLLDLLRALLDTGAIYAAVSDEAADSVGKALGIIGCVDPNRIEIARTKRSTLLLSNFDRADETIDWVIVLLEDVLVKAFKSVTNARAQGFLGYVIQELLRFCNFNDGTVLRPRASQASSAQQKWTSLPESVRITLTPFVKSRYVIQSNANTILPQRMYPGFSADQSHSQWLRPLVMDLMSKAKGDNAQMVFPLLARAVRGPDLGIASFLLPYAMLNIVLGGTVSEIRDMSVEIQAVLSCQTPNNMQQEAVKLSCENVFNVLDYMSTWLQEKKKQLGETRSDAYRTGHSPGDFDEAKDMAQVDAVEKFLASIPAESIASQAVLCGSYARALFHWEQYIRQKRPLIPSWRASQRSSEHEAMYNRMFEIYAQIDEPDGLEGISAHLPFLSEAQQALQHAKAGRWTAAQAWYESELAEHPENTALEDSVLRCLRETGQYAPLLRYADSFIAARRLAEDQQQTRDRLLPLMVEAEWMTGDLATLKSRVQSAGSIPTTDFNVGVADLLVSLKQLDAEVRTQAFTTLRTQVTQAMSMASTSSVHGSHRDLMRLHLLYEIEALSGHQSDDRTIISKTLERRLSVQGSYVLDKQSTLGIRRMAMQGLSDRFNVNDMGSNWLVSAKLARQSRNTQHAYKAVLRASDCHDKTVKMEEARLLWHDGHQRHAIQALEASIASGVFITNEVPAEASFVSSHLNAKQDALTGRANLLLAKWHDASGQTQAKDMTEKYQYAARHYQKWEKGHYYLGKHYQKLLEAERALPKEKQGDKYRGGELTRLVIENLLRSVPFGNKYWHETIPKLLTLWLDLGMDSMKQIRGETLQIFEMRKKSATQATRQLHKYFERVPAFVFYPAMPQMISRITHPHAEVWSELCSILTRIVATHPSQALWSLLAVTKATDKPRVDRGKEILSRLKDRKTNAKMDLPSSELRALLIQGQKLSEGLLQACEAHVEQRVAGVSLSKDLGFDHKLAPSPLVVPIELTLAPSLPSGAGSDMIRKHRAFVQDKITINSFSDHVLVLSSLQRPRKLTIRGSDGKNYGLLCKPKDDLRKDQRLMEFNGIINRALKRDAESSKRRLYIKTYAVTPLSEDSGTIEWVEGIKPMRDILLSIYSRKGIRPNYGDLRRQLDEASKDMQSAHIFNDKVLQQFPAVMHEWFTEVYAEPDTWFAARLRYARSAAVMSVTGHVLGLGDRHGENILLEEGTGGVFHVDFNCLFDKGLTFEKPEVVPFRLTHNMVDAMGPYGYEGPFRKSSELTLRQLRQSKDTLMTILETFLYDPTTDFVGKKKKISTDGVPETPMEILDSVEGKLKGLLRGEAVPLGVEGYVDALIRDATSTWNLSRMYIGWCAFL